MMVSRFLQSLLRRAALQGEAVRAAPVPSCSAFAELHGIIACYNSDNLSLSSDFESILRRADFDR